MNVDLHCHTKMTKSGDGIKRNIPSIKIFIEKLNQKKVGICAITNHNYFDVEQFKEICSYESDILFWPGIELDVEGEKSKGHCILICNPLCLNKFVDFCKKILSGSTCDNFKIKIKELVDEIKDLDLICISHYGSKKPSLNKEDQEIFYELLKGKIPFFFEPSNLRRAGILMAQNVSTLIGSDVKDWDKYEKCELPQLKIRIDSFDNFKKLLKKDDQVLRVYLNKKLKQEITISPYENCSIKLPIYDDVNVFFGGKGTGKTTILKKIEEYFSSKGISGISKYYAGEKNDIYKKLTESRFEDNDINKFEINDNLIDDFNIVLKYENPKVTPISQYVKWIDYRCKDHKFFFQEKNFSKILDLSNYERNFKQYENLCKNIKDIMNNDLFRRSNFSNIENFEKIFQEIKTGARNELYKVFCKCYVNKLFYDTINKMKKKYEKSTGFAAKPTQTGLVIMYDNLIRIHNSIKKISSQFKKDSIKELSKIGKLIDKGEIYLCREISINPTPKGDIKQKKCTKKNLIDIMNQIFEIEKKCFTSSLPSLMNDLITKLADCNINKIEDFMTLNTYTTTSDGLKYDLSNGEQSMIVLSKALSNENDEIFILDEPEMSVGHKYINDIIVPRIIELARANKIIIISTHDANIAIRTLPYLSVYREDCGNKVYKTYIGSAFCDIMTEYGSNNTLNWVKISMDVLEGGKTAFNERSEVYGDEKY